MTALPARRPSRGFCRPVARLALVVALAALLPELAPSARAEDAPAAAGTVDVLVLRDGRRLEGAVVADTPEAVTFRSGATTRMYLRADVERIERGAAPAAPAAPAGPADGAAADPGRAPAPSPAPGAAPTAPAPEKEKKAKKEDFGKKGKVLTDASRQWVRDLAARATSEDEQVRRSVAAALRALGPAAAPTVREEAEKATTPAARDFLLRIAADLDPRGAERAAGDPATQNGPTQTAPTPTGPAPEGGTGMSPDGGAAPPAGAPGQPPLPAPGGPGARRPGRGAVEKLMADLELREDQRPKMAEILGGLERQQFEIVREIRQGTLAQADVPARVETMRAATIEKAAAVLDVAQMDLFREHAQRYFDGLLLRASKGEMRGEPGGEGRSKKQGKGGGDAPQAPASGGTDAPKE